MNTQLQAQAKATSHLSITPTRYGVLQRSCGQHADGGECTEGKIQRAAVNPTPTTTVPPIVHQVISTPEHPLDMGTRAFMEPRFGYDFSGVRVHTDATVASGTIQRKAAKPTTGHCGGAYSCAAGNSCTETDNAGPFQPEMPEGKGTWQLKVYIDVDVASSDDIASAADVGHTYVEFIGSTGAKYTYGFYPRPERKPDEFHTRVFGCAVHPDTNHTSCVDYIETFNLTKVQYEKALKFAQDFCKAPDNYDLLSNNCTTFAQIVAKIAGQSLPGIRGSVAHGMGKADNPNTLLDNLKERDRKAGKP